MTVSARNQLHGTVSKLVKGMVNTEVDLTLDGGDTVTAIVTNKAVEALGLAEGSKAFAIVKASWVILSKGGSGEISARNNLCGTIKALLKGQVSTEVDIALPGGSVVTAILTNESIDKMKLSEGDSVCAFFKASNVILGV